jgi:hypothetical protein
MDRRVGVDVDNDVDVNVNLAMEVFTKMDVDMGMDMDVEIDMDMGIQEPKVAEWEDSDRTLEQLKNSESRETSLFRVPRNSAEFNANSDGSSAVENSSGIPHRRNSVTPFLNYNSARLVHNYCVKKSLKNFADKHNEIPLPCCFVL